MAILTNAGGPGILAVDACVARRNAHDRRTLEERSRYEQSFRQCMNLGEEDETARALSLMTDAYLLAALGRRRTATPEKVFDTLSTIWTRTLYG